MSLETWTMSFGVGLGWPHFHARGDIKVAVERVSCPLLTSTSLLNSLSVWYK